MGQINVNNTFYLTQHIQLLVERVNDIKIIPEMILVPFLNTKSVKSGVYLPFQLTPVWTHPVSPP